MQNKGFVKFLAVALTLICLFYLSFSVATYHVDSKAEQMYGMKTHEDSLKAQAYLDSLNTTPFYLGSYNLKQCRETAIGLGLDLKGGMNVMLEVSVADVLKALSDYNTDPAFLQSLKEAQLEANKSQDDFISLFINAYHKNKPEGRLAEIFATMKMQGDASGAGEGKTKITPQSTDEDVEKVLRAEVQKAVDNSFTVLRTRIDRFGVVQPNIQTVEGQMGRIMVELPGIKEPERVRKLLQGSANLEFWETYDAAEILPLLAEVNSALALQNEGAEEVADTTAQDTVVAQSNENLAAQLAGNIENDSTKVSDEAALEEFMKANPLYALDTRYAGGCVVGMSRDTVAVNAVLNSKEAKNILPANLRLLWGVKGEGETGRDFALYAIKTRGTNGKAPLTGESVTEAKDEFDNFGRPCVSMKMNSNGAAKWASLTEANVGHCIAIVLDGLVYSAPNVNNKIDGGSSQITGSFTTNDTKDLANVLQSGKMPAPAQIVQEDIVGPSLGQESINQGIMSFIVAFILLMVYMCVMYGFKPGMVANMALVLNFFFTIGILTSLQAALTMSGIAGMVLTLGMAVDANVLIYERTKEEMKAGKNLRSAVAAGYSNAFSAIFDSNLTSIITGVILFNFGTGPIKGFATTLIIGIVCSFFTAVWITRIVYENRLNKNKWQNITFTTPLSKNLMQGTKYNFMGIYKRSFIIFGVIILACAASFAIRGLSQSIDFTGGRNYKIEVLSEVEPEQVTAALQAKFNEASAKDENVEDATVKTIALGTDKKAVRVTTNYRIAENSSEVDAEIETILYETFKEMGVIDQSISRDEFVNPDERDGGSIISSQKVGPSIAKDITYGAIISVILALVAIFLYILLRFRNVAYSVGSTIALVIDTMLIIGAYSLCYGWIGFSLEIDQTFIGAILTAIGYSINDKVVIFDRIRENFGLYPKRDHQRLFNESLNQTLARTINTSASTLIVLLSIFIFGGESIRSFAFAMILGVVIGTLSSLFIAAPTAYLVMGRKIKEANAITEE